MSNDAIIVRDLVKQFGNVGAVNGLTFSMSKGRCWALLGGNGAGKTTSLAMMLGLVTPTSGQMVMLGHDMTTDRFAALAKMNFTSPYVDLPHTLTVWQNLDFYARLYCITNHKERLEELLTMFDLLKLRDRPSGKLSAGQKTRLGLAKALVNKPELLLLDEPTASLDPDTGDRLRSALEKYRHETGASILMASHNMQEVERMCDHVLMMKAGKIVDQGSPTELVARYGRANLEAVFLAIARGEDEGAAA